MLWSTCIFLFFLCLTHGNNVPQSSNGGTSPGLLNLIIGRCHQYQEFSSTNRLAEFSTDVNCSLLWETFKASFAYKDICKVKEKDYESLFKLLKNPKKSRQILFWTGSSGLVHDFSHINNKYVTLEDSFPGYLANNLRWCGCKTCPTGIDYNSCNQSCRNDMYWRKASASLAEKATEIAYVMVNGTTKGNRTAYQSRSYFASVELPRLGKLKQIKELVILVALDLNVRPREKCGEGSLITLVSDAKKYGIPKVTCQDNPVMVLGVLCAKYPHADICGRLLIKRDWKVIGITFIAISGVLFITIVLLFILMRKVRRRRHSPSSSTGFVSQDAGHIAS